jgi:hypothetical protein
MKVTLRVPRSLQESWNIDASRALAARRSPLPAQTRAAINGTKVVMVNPVARGDSSKSDGQERWWDASTRPAAIFTVDQCRQARRDERVDRI